MIGMFKGLLFGYYVYAFYIGTIYIEKGKPNPCNGGQIYNTGEILSVFIALMTGLMMVFGLGPNMEAFNQS